MLGSSPPPLGLDHTQVARYTQRHWNILEAHPAFGVTHLALGFVDSAGTLTVTNLSPAVWPLGSYLWPLQEDLPDPLATTTAAGDGPHTHDVPRPAALTPEIPPPGQAAQLVLVGFVNPPQPGWQGVTPVVLMPLEWSHS